MAVAGVEVETLDLSDEKLGVLCWRTENLIRAGYDVDAAITLAFDACVDLHQAVELRACGCPEATALRILLSDPPLAAAPESAMRHATQTSIRE